MNNLFLINDDIDVPYTEYEKEEPVPEVKNYDPSSAPVEWDWFEEQELPNFNWVINKLGICPGPITILSAFSNTGKTFFAAYMAICVANGFKFMDHIEVQSPGKVLHIDWDQGQKFSKIYYWRLLNGCGLKSFAGINYFKPEWHLHDKDVADKMVSLLSGYKLCIIDCLGSAIPVADINDDRVRQYIDMLNDISEKSNCAIVLIHHEPKGSNKDPLKMVKGNGSIISAAGGSIHLTRELGSQVISYELGKKRLVKDYKGCYTLDDCGEMSLKLGIEKGIKLTPCEEQNDLDESKKSLEIMKAICLNPGINTRGLRQLGGSKDIQEKIIKELHTNGLIRLEGIKPCKHFLTTDGESWLQTQELYGAK